MPFTYPGGGGGGGADNLEELNDVNLTTPADGDFLVYNGNDWVNVPLDVPSTVNDLTDATITGTPVRDHALVYDGSGWVNGDTNTCSPAISPVGPNRYYFPLGRIDGYSNFQFASHMTALKFNTNVMVNKWAIAYTNNGPSASGNSGIKVRAYIYAPGASGRPHTLVGDLGSTTIVPSDAEGGNYDAVEQVTFTPVGLNAGQRYFVGVTMKPVNPETHNQMAGPQFMVVDQGGLNPFWNNGINPVNFGSGSFGFRVGAYFNASNNHFGEWDPLTDTLANNIENSLGVAPHGIRVGLNVSSLDV